jgi:predicted Zn-dependent protease
MRRAVQLDPLSAWAHHALGGILWRAGRLDEAAAAYRKALELDPAHPVVRSQLAGIYFEQGRQRDALAEIEREPVPLFRLQGRALTSYALGQRTEAEAALKELIGQYHRSAAVQIAEVYAARGQVNSAFEWLDRAYDQRDGGLTEIKGNPLLKNLEGDSRYTALLKKMRLPA